MLSYTTTKMLHKFILQTLPCYLVPQEENVISVAQVLLNCSLEISRSLEPSTQQSIHTENASSGLQQYRIVGKGKHC